MAKTGEPDAADKWLVNQRFLNPMLTDAELGKSLGMSGSAVGKRLHKPGVIKLMERLQTDIYAQAIAIRSKAMVNAMQYINQPESKEGFEMTKMFAQAVADNQATMPDAPSEAPIFFDPKDEE